MKRALVVGCTGQDGHYLGAHLKRLGYQVTGLARDGVYNNGQLSGPAIDLCDGKAIAELVASLDPDEIYHLVAHHHSSDQNTGDLDRLFRLSFATHVDALLVLLEAIRNEAPRARLFYASSSLIFGFPDLSPQTEETPVSPVCPYGITKAAGLDLCRYYRDIHGLFCAAGILYNHESPRRLPSFVSRHIVQIALAIANGTTDKLVLGDPGVVIDWGYAPDYVDAMHRILQIDKADDFIVASGKPRRLREFINAVFGVLDVPTDGRIDEDASRLVRIRHGEPLIGDSSKLFEATEWKSQHSLEDIARKMVEAEKSQ